MSNRKAHRRDRSFRRHESFVQHRLRRPGRSERFWRQHETRRDRRSAWDLIRQQLADANGTTA